MMRLPSKNREVFYNISQIEKWMRLGLKYKIFEPNRDEKNVKAMIEWIKLLRDSNILLE